MSVLQISRVSHINGVLTLRLTSDQAANSVDFWLEFNPLDLAQGSVKPIQITTLSGWQSLPNFESPGEFIASAYLTQAASSAVTAPPGTTLMTLMLNVPSNRSAPLVLNFGGEVNKEFEQAESRVSIDLAPGSTNPITPLPTDNGGGNPPEPAVKLDFKPLDIGPLQVSSQLLDNKNLKVVVTGDWPVSKFDFEFELPANTPVSGTGAPQVSVPAGWGVSSTVNENILEVSAWMPLTQVNGQAVPAPLPAGQPLLTIQLESAVMVGQPLPTIFISGELNEEQNLVIERSSVSFTPAETPTPKPTFTHWRSKKALPDAALNAELKPEKMGPKDKTEASIGLTDVLSALKIYLGKPLPAEFTSPLNAVAADFDGNGSVGLNDVLGLLKYYLGKPTGGLAPEWVFINANAPTSGINKNNTLLPDVDLTGPAPELIGILRGDVDGSFSL
jgi:hypothetical protein